MYKRQRLRREQDAGFTGVAPFDEKVLVSAEGDTFQPLVSPDGTRLAYRQDRVTLRVLDLKSGRSVEVLGRDADRDLICMITTHGGTNPLEAGAYIVEFIKRMIKYSASGMKLREVAGD